MSHTSSDGRLKNMLFLFIVDSQLGFGSFLSPAPLLVHPSRKYRIYVGHNNNLNPLYPIGDVPSISPQAAMSIQKYRQTECNPSGLCRSG